MAVLYYAVHFFKYTQFQYLDLLGAEVMCKTMEHNYLFRDKGDSQGVKEFMSHDTSFYPPVTACPVAAVLCKTCGKFYFICNAPSLATSALLLAFSFILCCLTDKQLIGFCLA